MIVNEVVAVAIAYLLGSIPTAYLITRRVKGVDIRAVGDRYAGAKNVFREVGAAAGIATASGDIAKGAVAMLVARLLLVSDVITIVVALAVVAGHIWPVFLQFRGGAGFATTLGVVIVALPRESLILFLPYLLLAGTVGRRLGFGPVSAPFVLPLLVLAWWLGESWATIALPILVGALLTARVYHKEIALALGKHRGKH